MGGKPTAIPITEKDPPVSWAASQTGPRQQNEDDYGRADQDTEGYKWVHRGCLYLLADGMGGLDAGKEAAQTVVRQVIQEYTNSNGRSQDVAENLNQAIQSANQHLYKTSTRSGKRMGSTMVACVLKDGKATIAHAGDSRAYQLANGNVRRLTRDHLYATEVQGIKDDDEAKRSPEGHKITRALGKDPDLRVDINEVEYAAGDRFLLCSDGISEALSQEEIEACLCEKTPEKAVHALCSQAGPRLSDNATVVVVFASGNKIRRQKTVQRVVKYAAVAALFIAILGGGYEGWRLLYGVPKSASAAAVSPTPTPASRPLPHPTPSEEPTPESGPSPKGTTPGPRAKPTQKPSPAETRTPDKSEATMARTTPSPTSSTPATASSSTPAQPASTSPDTAKPNSTPGAVSVVKSTPPATPAAPSTSPTPAPVVSPAPTPAPMPASSVAVPKAAPTPTPATNSAPPMATNPVVAPSSASSKNTGVGTSSSQKSTTQLHVNNNTPRKIKFWAEGDKKHTLDVPPNSSLTVPYTTWTVRPVQICWNGYDKKKNCASIGGDEVVIQESAPAKKDDRDPKAGNTGGSEPHVSD
jgi:serine/threonine protein phosphatase PrpC